MPSPRWRKVLRDLWGAKFRTLLVVLSIAIGVLAVGVVTQTFNTIEAELSTHYPETLPAHATLYAGYYDDEFLQTIRRLDGVALAEGRSTFAAKIRTGGDQWRQIILIAIPDYAATQIDKISLERTFAPNPALGAERGVFPPPNRGALFERSSFLIPGLVPAEMKVGDPFQIEMPEGRRYDLTFSGLIYAPTQIPSTFANAAFAYVTRDTAEWLTGSRQMDQIVLRVSQPHPTLAQVTQVADRARAKLESDGRMVTVQIPEPEKHPIETYLKGLLVILNALGIASLFLSAFLVVNTVSAVMAQQVRQIGMMKAVGAQRGQLVTLYLGMVLAYGVLAFLVAAPLAMWISDRTTQLLAGFANVRFPAFQIMPEVLLLEASIAILFPLLAAIPPVLSGTRLTVREAISDYGIGRGPVKSGWLDRGLQHVRGLSRPMMLSLRNTFRRKGRLVLTVTTLTLAGAIFVAIFSMYDSMLLTLEDVLQYWQFDVLTQFDRAYRTEAIDRAVRQVPGVVYAESWGLTMARRVRADDSESKGIVFFAPPARTQLLRPTLIQGRWLLPDDENAIVISNGVAAAEPDIKVGEEIKLKFSGKESTWRVVGMARVVGSFGGASIGTAYANYEYAARISGQVGRAGSVQVMTDRHDAAYQDRIKTAIEEQFKAAGIHTSASQTSSMIRESNNVFFMIIVGLLGVMAALMAAVGGLGLMGTMALNVIERTREIGVMRAIGASARTVAGMVMVEGLLIGLTSWVLGTLLAIPFGGLMGEALGALIFQMPLHYAVSIQGMGYWLIAVIALSIVATCLPALNASRLTVRQVLAYE